MSSRGVAVVSGASRGLGASIAQRLAADGWPVAVNYRHGRVAAESVVGKIGEAGGVVVVGAHGKDHAGARGEPGGEEHEDEDDDDDPTDGRSGPSSRLTPERPTVALATRESGLHLWPHDSIGGVNERKLASRFVETTRPSTL